MRRHPSPHHAPLKDPDQARSIKRGLAAGALLLTLLCAGAWAQPDAGSPTLPVANATTAIATIPAPADAPEVKPGQSALEFALEHAPPGVTLEQFVLALIELNPQAFLLGERAPSGSRLQLPTAEQAGRVPADLARAQLLALRANRADNAAPLVQAPAASAEAARPIPEMVWVVCAAALMVLAVLLLRRNRDEGRKRANTGGPKPHIPTTPTTPTTATTPPEPQPSRYRPALPPESQPTVPRHAKPAAAPDSPAPESPSQAAARPAAPTRPLDFSGIDLDLGSPQRDKP